MRESVARPPRVARGDDRDDDTALRAMAAADIAAGALGRGASHMALDAAQEAARAALLVLGGSLQRQTNGDLRFLTDFASAPPDHLAGRPDGRAAVVRRALSIVARLIPSPSEAGGARRG